MLSPAQCAEYNEVSKRQYSSNTFLEDYITYCNYTEGVLFDFGTGPGHHLNVLKNQFPKLDIVGFENSDSMLELARSNTKLDIRKQNFTELKEKADCVICLHTLHHLRDPMMFWKVIKDINPESFYLEDLIRPEHSFEITPFMTTDFINSVYASFTVEEIHSQLNNIGLSYEVETKHIAKEFYKVIVYQKR